MGLQADLHGPARRLPEAVQPLVAARERAAILDRLRGEVRADVHDLQGHGDVLHFDGEGRGDLGHKRELEKLLAFTQEHLGLLMCPDRQHRAFAAPDLDCRIGAEHPVEHHAKTAVGGKRPARQSLDA